MRALTLFAAAALASVTPAIAQSVDPNLWATDGPVQTIVRDGNTLYVGGSFTRVAPATGGGVPLAAATGSPLRPFPRVAGSVYAVISDGSGGWFVGGEFTSVGGVERLNLAHILSDGTVAPWAPNPNAAVQALALDGNQLYVGGWFSFIGARWRDHIAAVHTTTGVATAWNPGANAGIYALAAGDGIVYAGGDFSFAGGQPRSYFAALDSSSGTAAGWVANANGTVRALALRGGTLYMGGAFSTIDVYGRSHLAALDVRTGAVKSWNPAADGIVLALAVSDGLVYVGGEFPSVGNVGRGNIAAVDSATGAIAPWNPNANASVTTLSVANGIVYAGGSFTRVSGLERLRIAAIDATTSQVLPWNPAASAYVSAIAASGGAVYVGGGFTGMGGVARNNAAALDVLTGTATPWDPSVNGPVSSMAVSAGRVYLAGGFLAVGGQGRNRIAAVDATTGSLTGWNPSADGLVRALVVSGNTVYAGGGFRTVGGQGRSSLAALDATSGAATNWSPNPNYDVEALALNGNTLFVGGQFSSIAGQTRNHLAAFDLSTGLVTGWDPNANSTVEALVVDGGALYAGGGFTAIGGQPRNRIAVLDAATGVVQAWNPNAGQYWVSAIAAGGGAVYAGGYFTSMGGLARPHIAALDAASGMPTDWNPGATDWVGTLAVGDSVVYAGGTFRSIAGEPQPYLAAIRRDVSSPASVPVFVGNVGLSTNYVTAGDPVTITAVVRNDGADSDDGRIVFSFRDLTDPADSLRVTGTSSGGTPGLRVYPRGSILLDRNCRPVTATYLMAEYADSAWAGRGAEYDTLRLTVRPRTGTVLGIDVRSTMHAAGAAPCDYVSAMPSDGGTTLTDQQGWPVKRFSVYVTGTPLEAQPIFNNPRLSAGSITLGQTLTLSTSVWNAGALSDDGRIAVSFPGLTDPLDSTLVTSFTWGDARFRVIMPGSTLPDTACRPIVTPYLVAEWADSLWEPIGHESNGFDLTVKPRAVGTFSIDVRATMRTAFGPACAYVNGVPATGQVGFRDPQGWPVTRYSVTVLPPPTAAAPSFIDAVAVSADTLVLGEVLSITANVRNLGLASDDGRIVMSFPTLTDPADVGRVSSQASGDNPGFRVFPSGSSLLGSACQTVTGSCLVAEYADSDWQWVGTETNYFMAQVKPPAVGDFVVYVRSTMHTAGGAPCAYLNGLPPNGEDGFTDPQGWPVKRFIIHVKPAPTTAQPVFTGPVTMSTPIIQLGDYVTITAGARNLGAASDDGRIAFSFPALDQGGDAQRFEDRTWEVDIDNQAAIRLSPAGSPLRDQACQPATAPCLAAEYIDTNWQWIGKETHTVRFRVRPREVGTFAIDVRTTMRTAGGDSCGYVNALPLNGADGYVDPQGWTVRRFEVEVVPIPPVPVFAGLTFSAGTIQLGQAVTIAAQVRNDGTNSDDGRVVFDLPDLTGPDDGDRVSGGAPNMLLRTYPAGSPMVRADCTPITAGYLTAEYSDPDWRGAEVHACTLTVRPRHAGTFGIYVRSTMHAAGAGPCGFVSRPPYAYCTSPDQQGWAVCGYAFTVLPHDTTAVPTFAGDVSVSTDVIGVGGSLVITAVVRNLGAWSDDGRIAFSFPTLDQPGDAQYIGSSAAGDTPGFRRYSAGATLTAKTCQPVTARYATAEYADAKWDSIGDEADTFTVIVQPPRQGPFPIEIRSTMHTAGAPSCVAVNGLPPNGVAGTTDQQGWEVKHFDVYVASTPSLHWQKVGAPGIAPDARTAQSIAYDNLRDELVLYGGGAQHYLGDSWTLPLPDNSSWNQLQPGGPVPLRRTGHSMIFDPVGGGLMIFGGQYDIPLNDLWVLARSPVTWWFPIDVPGVRPSPRTGHAAVYDPLRRRMLVIGGYDGGLLNDVWEYSPMVNGTWHRLAPAGDPMPPRCNLSAAYDPVRDRVLIFGGDGGYPLNDTWALQLGDSLAWQPIATTGGLPAPRREHSGVYDLQADQLTIFGGFDGTRRLNDVWTLSLTGTPQWERRYSVSASPTPRSGHSAVFDPRRQRMVVFGGQVGTSAYTNEVWELTIDQLTPVALSLAETEVASDHVRLTWFGEGAGSLAASVERSTGAGEWLTVGAAGAQGPDQLVFRDTDVVPGTRYAYRLRVWQGGEEELLAPVWVSVPALAVLSLAGASPNPVSGEFTVAFSLPEEGQGALELFDLHGRRVARQELSGMPAGPHRIVLADGQHLAAGVYWVRLTHHDRHLIAKACVVR